MKVDYANRDVSKQIIQGVSGVGGDVMDIWSPGGDMHYFKEIGILEDVTDSSRGQTTHLLMAAVTMSVVPLIILFVVLQKHLVRGIQLGSVKG